MSLSPKPLAVSAALEEEVSTACTSALSLKTERLRAMLPRTFEGHEHDLAFEEVRGRAPGKDGRTAENPATLFLSQQEFDLTLRHLDITIYGCDPSRPLAYATHHRFEGTGSLEEAIKSVNRTGFGIAYFYGEEPVVSGNDLIEFDGFNRYTGTGEILFVDRIEALRGGLGSGKRLLIRLMSDPDIELVVAHARNEDTRDFFLRNGFIDSGLHSGTGRDADPVVVWHNHYFSAIDSSL